MDPIDKEFIHGVKVNTPTPQQQKHYGQLVLKAQGHTYGEVLDAEQDRECHPEYGCKKTAAEVQQEADETKQPPWFQVKVEVVFGPDKVRRPNRATCRV